MLLAFHFAPVQLTQLLITVLSTYVTQLTLINLEEIYKSNGYVTDNYRFIAAPVPQTFVEANTFCQSKAMEMFTTTADMNLLDLFSKFATATVWTQIYQHGITKALVNVDQFIPVTITKDTVISLPNIVIPDKYLITLKKNEDNTIVLDPQPATEKYTTICMERSVYPNTVLDRANLESFRKVLIASVKESIGNLKVLKKGEQLALKNIPNLGKFKKFQKEIGYYNLTLETDDVVDLTSAFEKTIKDDLQQLIDFSTNKWKTISNPDELVILESNNRLILQKVNSMILKLWNSVMYPISIIPYESLENVTMTKKPDVGITKISGFMSFVFHFPGEKGINWLEFPMKRFQVLDPNWIGFFKMTLPDLLFSIFFGISVLGYMIHFACEAHELYKKRTRINFYRSRSKSIPLQVRKIETSRRPSLISQRECTPDSQYEESPEPTRKYRHSKKNKPKKHRKVHVKMEMERSMAPARHHDAQYGIVRILNMNMPVGDGNSDISE